MATTILKASVYVGTYRKYNNGSLDGAWMKLSDYRTRKDFIKACLELHNDEEDPELMFQDKEAVPESMIGESHIDDEVWHVMNSIKKYNPDKADDFASWCEDNGAEQDYNALREFLGWNKKKDKTERLPGEMTKERKEEILKKYTADHSDINYYANIASYIWEVNGGFVIIDKPKIETSFCFNDEDEAAMEIYNHFTEEYFLKENLKEIEKEIENIKGKTEEMKQEPPYMTNGTMYLVRNDRNLRQHLEYITPQFEYTVKQNPQNYTKMTEKQLEEYLEILKNEKKKFEKRLNGYLKRYGVKKCKTWTYWANA